MPANLVESSLFGHRRGAFTGALQDHRGYLAVCPPEGAVFLDEIGELDPAIQVKLLRVLQTRSYEALGSTRTEPFTGKLLAATNRDLSAAMRDGTIREDFYYRLCADHIARVPRRQSAPAYKVAGVGLVQRHIPQLARRQIDAENLSEVSVHSILLQHQ